MIWNMNTRMLLFVLLVLIAFNGCDKDKFPNEFNILGPWIEKEEADFRVEIEFRTSSRVFLKRSPEGGIDTLMYRLDKADELRLFLPADFPAGPSSAHRITYSQRSEQLTIYGLMPLAGETSVTVFRRK